MVELTKRVAWTHIGPRRRRVDLGVEAWGMGQR
jgi:hypothetical protein